MLLRALLLTALALVVPYVSYLTLAYNWPRLMGSPSLEQGLVALGHMAPGEQLLWAHCNARCRSEACKRAQGMEEQRQKCAQQLRVSVRLRGAGVGTAWLPADAHVRVGDTLPPRLRHTLPLVNATLVQLHGLKPCTRYEYRASMVLPDTAAAEGQEQELLLLAQDEFRSAPAADQPGCGPRGSAALAPLSSAAASADVRVVWGSCLGPSPFSDLRVFRWLLEREQEGAGHTDMVLLLGDTVYTDIPAVADDVAYAQVWSDAAFQALFRRVPFVATYDDHELVNDWSLADSHQRFEQAMVFFDEWNAKNPPPPPEWDVATQGPIPSLPPGAEEAQKPFALSLDSPASRRRYFSFDIGSLASFFVLDTRQYATPPVEKGGTAEPTHRTRLGAEQLAQVKAWLVAPSTRPFKFLCSSIAWSSLAWKPRPDGWADFVHERRDLFDFIAAHGIRGVTLLSADLHWSGSFHFRRYNLHEVSVSPLQSFGLPSWNHADTAEEVQTYLSQWANHAGILEMHAGAEGVQQPQEGVPLVQATAPGAWLNVSVFKYMYARPRRHRSIILRWDDMRHDTPVSASQAQHKDAWNGSTADDDDAATAKHDAL